jgi:hypothetical protein
MSAGEDSQGIKIQLIEFPVTCYRAVKNVAELPGTGGSHL